MSTATAPILDIGRTLDDGPFTGMQKMVVLMAALAIVLDGFDGQFIGFAIPLMIKEWGASKEAFGVPVAAGLIGMAVGMAVAGVVADRIGRRLVLAASVFVFGATTVAIGFTPNLLTLTVLRFIAGMGIGGALPCSSTLTAEYTPARAHLGRLAYHRLLPAGRHAGRLVRRLDIAGLRLARTVLDRWLAAGPIFADPGLCDAGIAAFSCAPPRPVAATGAPARADAAPHPGRHPVR